MNAVRSVANTLRNRSMAPRQIFHTSVKTPVTFKMPPKGSTVTPTPTPNMWDLVNGPHKMLNPFSTEELFKKGIVFLEKNGVNVSRAPSKEQRVLFIKTDR